MIAYAILALVVAAGGFLVVCAVAHALRLAGEVRDVADRDAASRAAARGRLALDDDAADRRPVQPVVLSPRQASMLAHQLPTRRLDGEA